MDQAVVHCTEGVGIWQWASNDQNSEPDVVMACCGDTPTLKILAAVSILREHLPELKIRVVNVVDLMKLQPSTKHPHGLTEKDYDSLFTKDKHIVFGFRGYPWLCVAHPSADICPDQPQSARTRLQGRGHDHNAL
jgi:xylulose-5-phosphate/fructose-6-phosphate phosphoketolase